MSNKIVIYIEIEKNSNIEYKYCEKNKLLVIDKVLDPPQPPKTSSKKI